MERKTWNKGQTKETNLSVMKISQTMRERHIDNFKNWRKKMVEQGVLKTDFSLLNKDEALAELIGVILGDGNISEFPRCERLIISSNSSNEYFIQRYASIVEGVFGKKPSICKTNTNCIRISLYQKKISERLLIPMGARGKLDNLIPSWVKEEKNFKIACLKGLFEAEGSLSIHLPTYTYNFSFSNLNKDLLNFVKISLEELGFHPEERSNAIRLRRRKEVEEFENLIKFRK